MQVTYEECIDDSGLAKYFNHSGTKANCATRTQVSDEQWRVFIIAKRNLKLGEELLYDYKMVNCDEAWAKE